MPGRRQHSGPVSCLQIRYDVGRIRQKMKELAVLHDQHLNRPTLDDSSEQEHAIEITTQEVTQVRRAPGGLPTSSSEATLCHSPKPDGRAA